jgi:CheY-like chemotaxis protein
MKENVILLIEDNELDVLSVQRSLKKLDMTYQLFTAFNGIEALDMLNGTHGRMPMEPLPTVILLDINMPKMNGLEFLRALRSDDRLSDIRVFIMTTSAEDFDRKTTEELGVSGYLIKPMSYSANYNRADSMENFVQFHIRKILQETHGPD